MSSVLLEMKNIEFNYDVSDEWILMVDKLCFMSGEITGIVGPNGSGKSTLLRIAAGVISADTGDVLLQDNNIAGMSRKCIAGIMGYLPQESTSLYDYTVAEVVRMGRYAHQSGFAGYTEEDIEAVNSALATTGLDRYRRKRLSCLSVGGAVDIRGCRMRYNCSNDTGTDRITGRYNYSSTGSSDIFIYITEKEIERDKSGINKM